MNAPSPGQTYTLQSRSLKQRREKGHSLSAEHTKVQTKLRVLRQIALETSTRLTRTSLGLRFTPKA